MATALLILSRSLAHHPRSNFLVLGSSAVWIYLSMSGTHRGIALAPLHDAPAVNYSTTTTLPTTVIFIHRWRSRGVTPPSPRAPRQGLYRSKRPSNNQRLSLFSYTSSKPTKSDSRKKNMCINDDYNVLETATSHPLLHQGRGEQTHLHYRGTQRDRYYV